ncbi:MAG TPA: hypothetical protein VK886_21020 [Vicinamibacterales bacterium]|nr:hypothetical protein [Vicinamibacterales bacterium]
MDAMLPRVLVVLGAGFLVANIRLLLQFARFMRLRSSALLTWPAGRPPYALFFAALAGALGLLVIVKLVVQQRPPFEAFGESMMLIYYGYAAPLSWRIGRGFYRDGIWSDSGFMRYAEIGGLTWREDTGVTLVLISRARRLARRLVVPMELYGEARRILRDHIASHNIHFAGQALDLGGHDEREDV